MSTQAQIRASKKYNDENIKGYSLKLNLKTDMDIIEKLETVESKQGYIKELIRKDMKKKYSKIY